MLIFLQTNIAKTKVTLISLKRQGWSLAEKNFLRVYVFFKAYPPILRSLMRRANLHLGALFVQQLRTEVGLDKNMYFINTHNHEIDNKCPIVKPKMFSQVWPQGPSCHKYLKDAIYSSPPLGGQFKYKTMQISVQIF